MQVPARFTMAQEQENPLLCVGDYQTEDEAKQQLKRFSELYNNLEEWEKRAGIIREGILKGAELSPLPEKDKDKSHLPKFKGIRGVHCSKCCI